MEYIKLACAWLGTTFIYLIGGLDIAFQCVSIFIVADYITGILKASKKENLNSRRGIEGIKSKVGILVLVVISTMLDRAMGNTGFIRTPTIYFLVANEGISILENLGQMGIKFPKFLKDKLEQLKEESEENVK